MTNPQPDARTALATRRSQQDADGKPPTLDQRIANRQNDFQLAMPRGLEATRLVRDALTCLRTIRHLSECDPDSVLGALMTCAQLGLRPGVLGHAWPIPYWDKRTGSYRAQLVIGYQGLIELGHRSGQISSLIARTVHEHDHFDVDYGLADALVHKPNLRAERGDPIAYYAIAKFTSGGHAFIVMSHDDMIKHRDRYAPRNKQDKITGPWVDNFEAMALKTTIRQLAKYMPKSTDLAEAIAADGGVRIDLTPTIPASDVTGTAHMWDGQEVGREITDRPAETAAQPPAAPATTGVQQPGLRKMHALRNQLEGFAGTSPEARELFLVHVASIIGHEITSTKELTPQELADINADLEQAIEAQKQRAEVVAGASALRDVAGQQATALRTVTDPPQASGATTEEGFPY